MKHHTAFNVNSLFIPLCQGVLPVKLMWWLVEFVLSTNAFLGVYVYWGNVSHCLVV